MDRRSFLALGASTTALAAVGCEGLPPPDAPAIALPPDYPAEAPSLYADLEEATVASLAGRMARGEISAREITARYLVRIDALDGRGPAIRSILDLNPDALSIAAERDEERAAGKVRGPLHGIPVLLKDNIDTGDRMRTTAGSLALSGPAPRDAHLVARLRAAGAIILGKTNLSEWANIRDNRSTSGWSARGGLTKNPYALDRNTSGSSSGSAAAIAANLAAVAVGTETDGSIVSPASICGIVGIKPTIGLVSRSGIVPIAHSQDTAGPMTRTVADAAILLAALAGPDPRDPATAGAPRLDYTRSLVPDGVKGMRLGVVRGFGVGKAAMAIFDAAVADLRRLGAVVVDDVSLGDLRKLEAAESTVLLTELKADMARYLAERGAPGLRALDDLIRFNTAHAAEELGWFGQDLFEEAARMGPLDGAAYREARALCLRLARDEGIDAAIAKHKLDALIAPTGGPAWITDRVNGDAFTGSCSTPAAVAGYPHITVPAGQVSGLPIGISFFAGAFQEPALIRAAYAYEQATRRRFKPAYRSTAAAP